MPVIAMTREMGSSGREVTLGLAEELNLDIVQHELVEHVADKMDLQKSLVNRYLEGKANLFERWGIDESSLSLYTTEEILEVAARGNVLIRGWGASYVLRNVKHVVCVRICAPAEYRISVIMDRVGVEYDDAAQEIKSSDAEHAKIMQHLFRVDWTDPTLYDVVLNTERVSVNGCIDMVKHLAARESFQETEESRERLKQITFEARVRRALKENSASSELNPSFDVEFEPGTGKITLTGVAPDEGIKQEAEQIVAAVTGVTEVANEIVVNQIYIYPLR